MEWKASSVFPCSPPLGGAAANVAEPMMPSAVAKMKACEFRLVISTSDAAADLQAKAVPRVGEQKPAAIPRSLVLIC
jgi:hypothetical protein